MTTHTRHVARSGFGRPAGRSAPGRRSERGAAVVVAMLACILMSATLLAVFNSSHTANRSATLHDSKAESAAAAEYGANLAVAEIAAWSKLPGNSGRDWVYGEDGSVRYVNAASEQSLDQRRFEGFFGGQNFRVMVRSAGLAKEHDTMPDKWLWKPTDGETLYEVTSSARAINAADLPAERQTEATVQTVLNLKFQDGWDSGAPLGPIALTDPVNFQPTLAQNVVLSGEDHDINKYYVEKFETERIVTPLKLFTTEANYFGAKGGYWSNGCLTLNYQTDPERVNPYRPRTPSFSTNSRDREMKVLDSGREVDTYLLGGKNNRTVTLDSSGRIIETSASQANEGGNFNVVLGAFEDLMNLYINMAGITPSNSYPNSGAFEDTGQWFQQYIGQYTDSARSSTVNSASIPLYAGTRIRAQTFHMIKNKDGHALVREFEQGGSRYNYMVSSSAKWEGNYTWAPVDMETTSGKFYIKGASSRTVVPRMFMWQELVGFSLVKRPNGHPALNPDGTKRTMFALDVDGQKIPVGFDENFQRNGANVNTVMTDRFDTIYVRQADGSLKAHTSMNDFLFEKEFGNDASGEPIVRDALCIFIGYEDQREHQADYNYSDMMFDIYVAPSVEQQVIPYTLFTLLTDQWWEQNSDNGLTGRPSHPALVTNKSPSTVGAEDVYKANYDLLGYSPKKDPDDPDSSSFEEQVYTMRVGPEFLFVDGQYFLRVKLDEDGSGGLVFVPVEDEHGVPLTGHANPYYYTEDDINNFLIHEWNAGNKAIATEEGRDEARGRFGDLFPSGYRVVPMDDRWVATGVSKPILDEDEANTAYKVLEKTLSFRQIAADILGYKYQAVPVVDTYEFNAVPGLGGVVTPQDKKIGFIAGEMVRDTAYTELAAVPDEGIPHRVRVITQEDGTTTPIREYLANSPAAAVAMAYEDYYMATGTPALRDEVEEIYGLKDKRFSIGFHRSGADSRFAERHSQDHYEVVSMGVLGFNPFRTTNDGRYIAKNSDIDPNGPEKPYYNYVFKYGIDGMVPDFVFDKPIDGAGIMIINGNLVVEDVFAYYGLLLVMGDVIIRPTYDPERLVFGADGNPMDEYGHSLYKNGSGKWEYVWIDPDGTSEPKPTAVQLDESGNKRLTNPADPNSTIPVEPVYATGADAYRGRLVTQGNLLVNGRLRTETVEMRDADGNGTGLYVTGELQCYASDAANDLSNKLADVHKDIVEVISWTSGTSSSTSIANAVDKLWSGDN